MSEDTMTAAGGLNIAPGGQKCFEMSYNPKSIVITNDGPQRQNTTIVYTWIYADTTIAPKMQGDELNPGGGRTVNPEAKANGNGQNIMPSTFVLYNTGTSAISAKKLE